MNNSIKNVIFKLKSHLQIEKDRDLAETMGVNSATFSSWKNRNAIDYDILLNFCFKNNISLDWLFEFDTQNAIREPKTQYESEKLSKFEVLENRIEILEKIIKDKI